MRACIASSGLDNDEEFEIASEVARSLLGCEFEFEIFSTFSIFSKPDRNPRKFTQNSKQKWKIKPPYGNIIWINNKEKYCTDNGLSSSLMSAVASGRQTHHKGYSCEKVEKI